MADMALGVPYIAAGAPNSEQFVPQWLSLERLHAYSLKKGCYPGQEIVARMHYLGHSKRAGFLLTGEGLPPAAMTHVLDTDGKAAGEIVWSLPACAGWSALAVLGKDTADGAGLGLDLPDRSQTIRAERLSPPH
jgi:folate-binding protein YgfZ